MGYGLPSAIGARFAADDDQSVVCFDGDGSFLMTLKELAVAARENLDITVFVLNNEAVGMVRQWQDGFFEGRRMASEYPWVPDFATIAEAFGARGYTIDATDGASEVEDIVSEALGYDGPSVVDAHIDPTENVYPMVERRCERRVRPRGGTAMTEGLQGPAPDERPQPSGRRNAQGIRIDPAVAAEPEPRRTVLSALVENEPGVLATISGLVSRRQFNIESLTVGTTTNPETSRVTLVIEEPDPGVRQVEKQLDKVINVISVRELGDDAVRRELVVLNVHGEEPDKVNAVTDMYDGETLDAGPRTITVQITGDEQKVDDAIDAFQQFGIRELARTGQTALARGEEWTTHAEEERYERMQTQS